MAPWKIAVLAGLLLIVASVSGAVYYVNHLLGKTMDLGVDMAEKTNPNLDIETKRVQKGFWKIAVFGVDSTDGNLGKGANSDVIIICSINWETGEIKMSSVYRDTFLKVGEKNPYRKINEAYARGGPDQAINALNENLDIEVDDFVSVNWKAIADGINILGGVDIEVDVSEVSHLNNYQLCIAEDLKREYTPVTQTGYQRLDGLQATGYCRIRYTAGDDFKRAERQREVLSAVADQAKKASLPKLTETANSVFEEVYTSLDLSEIVEMLGDVGAYQITETDGFPQEDMRATGTIGSKGSCVIPTSLEENVKWLHEFLFDASDYEPSATVKECSEKIYQDTSGYLTK